MTSRDSIGHMYTEQRESQTKEKNPAASTAFPRGELHKYSPGISGIAILLVCIVVKKNSCLITHYRPLTMSVSGGLTGHLVGFVSLWWPVGGGREQKQWPGCWESFY